MDLITQGILGGAIAQAGYQNKLGRKAVMWGAIIGMAPDIDVFLLQFSGHPMAEQLYHRGFTHSLFFAPLAAPIIAAFLCKIYDKRVRSENYGTWLWLAFWCLITHPLLDIFTTYGTQLLNPLSNYRFSLSGISVIDPLYSLPLLLVTLIGLSRKMQRWHSFLTSFMLLLTTAYLFYGVTCNQIALSRARSSLLPHAATRLNSYPTLFQIHVRRLVAHVENEVWIAYTSTFPGVNYPIRWERYQVADPALCSDFLKTSQAQIYDWFCDGDYALINSDNTLKMHDLRFGFVGPSQLGIWGIQAKIDTDGKLLEAPYKFSHSAKIMRVHSSFLWTPIWQLGRASFGHESMLWGIHH